MKATGIVARGIVAAALIAGLAGCPSPLLTAIKGEIAKAPFTGAKYNFLRQWGNPTPQYSFYSSSGTLQVKADTAGYVYVLDSSARVRKFDSSGSLIKTFNLNSSQGLFGSFYDMAFDASGNMYVTNSVPQVQKYDVNGNFLVSWGSSTNFSTPAGITVDSNGYVYVVDSGNNNVQVFDTSGNPQASSPWTSASLSYPHGITNDGTYVYIADTSNNRIVKMWSYTNAPSGTVVASWGGATTFNGITLSGPMGVTIDSSLNMYIADTTRNRTIETNNTTGAYIATLTGTFASPNSVVVDTAGSVYVVDNGGATFGRVQKFVSGSLVAAWGGTPGTGNGLVDFPEGVALDSSGNVYVADIKNNRIQKFDPSGNFLLQWGIFGSANGQFEFSNGGSFGIAVDSSGKVYVPDSALSRVQVFDTSGNWIKILAGSGTGTGLVSSPESVAVDSSGNVYVDDSGNGRIEVFNSSGYYVTQWSTSGLFIVGICVDSTGHLYAPELLSNTIYKYDTRGNFITKIGSVGSGNGQLFFPFDAAVDQLGNLYVTDLGNRRVEKFDPSGNYMGSFGSAPGAGNGSLAFPVGIAVNSSGQVVVSDVAGNIIQEFAPAF